MKVKKLIEYLQECNPEATVKVGHSLGAEVFFVLRKRDDDSVVWIEDEHDFDMKNELKSRVKAYDDDCVEECDFYNDLIEDGFTPKMIRKYIGDEEARLLEFKCREYGCHTDDVKITIDELDDNEVWGKFYKNAKDTYYIKRDKIPECGDIVYLYDNLLDAIFTMEICNAFSVNERFGIGFHYDVLIFHKGYNVYLTYK